MSAHRTHGPGASTAHQRWAAEVERELSAGGSRQVPKGSIDVRHHPKKPRESDGGWRRKEGMQSEQGTLWASSMRDWERFSGARRAPVQGAVAIDGPVLAGAAEAARPADWARSAAQFEEWAEDHVHLVGTDQTPRLAALRRGSRGTTRER